MKKNIRFCILLTIVIITVSLSTCDTFIIGITDAVPLVWNGRNVYHHDRNVTKEIGMLVGRRTTYIGGTPSTNLPAANVPFFAKEAGGAPYSKPLYEENYMGEYIYIPLTEDADCIIRRLRGSGHAYGATLRDRTGDDPAIGMRFNTPTSDEAILIMAEEILILNKNGTTFSVIDVGENYSGSEPVTLIQYNKHFGDETRARNHRRWIIRGPRVEYNLHPQFRNDKWWANFFGFEQWLPCHIRTEFAEGKPSPVHNFPSQVRFRVFFTYLATHEEPDIQTARIPSFDGIDMGNMNDQPKSFYSTRRARQIADNLLAYQQLAGGWDKNVDMVNNADWYYLDNNEGSNYFSSPYYSTLDNDSTHVQLQFLGKVISAGARDQKYMDSFYRGLQYVLRAQYPSGGFPQFFDPTRAGYWSEITINDDAMASVMELLEDIYQQEWHMSFLAKDMEMYAAAVRARNMAIECILRAQQKVRGLDIRPHDQFGNFSWLGNTALPPNGTPDQELTIWSQQHHITSLVPTQGRAYEMPCLAGMESVSIIEVLMRIPNPGPRIRFAINSSMNWYRRTAMVGYMQERTFHQKYLARGSLREMYYTGNPGDMVWGRFYEIVTGTERLHTGRDTQVVWDMYEITESGRAGYMNIHDRGKRLFPQYEQWLKRLPDPNFPEFNGLPEMTWPGMPENLEVDRERMLTWQQLKDMGEIK